MTCNLCVSCDTLRMYGRLRLPLLLQVLAPNLILFLCIVTLLLQGWSIEAFVGFDGQVQQSKLHTVAIYGNPSPLYRRCIVWTAPQPGPTAACTRSGAPVRAAAVRSLVENCDVLVTFW